jgi:sigma-B regulation protein RsbU (phosphoserine phosphatase)
MRILIAEDDSISRIFLERTLQRWGYEVLVTDSGDEAWRVLDRPDPPPVAILDWMMPGLDGTEVCRRIRQGAAPIPTYVILLTSRNAKEDTVVGLLAGADDYLTKPFDENELHARLQVGLRLIDLQRKLADQVAKLAEALVQVKQLHGLLPMCSWCKKIRDDSNYWHQIETYITRHSDAEFTHGICPDCADRMRAEVKQGGA